LEWVGGVGIAYRLIEHPHTPQQTAFTMKAGFLPSSLALTGAWLYMATTGLLIAETSLNLAKSHRPGAYICMSDGRDRGIGSTS
jgi:hypothetical protein